MLGLRFCARAFSSCGEQGPLFIAVRGPLTVVASHCGARLQTHRLSSCGSRAQLLHGMWDLPGPGLEPMSSASAGRLSTTAPPGKPPYSLDKHHPCPLHPGEHQLTLQLPRPKLYVVLDFPFSHLQFPIFQQVLLTLPLKYI